jgi:uncharacterized membrane protein YhhN
MPMPWVLFILLLIVLPIYITTEYKSKSPWVKLALKTACSLLFLLTAIAAMTGAAGGWQACFGWFVAAFLLSAAGDVLLSWPMKQSFTLGLGAFFLAQCMFAVALCLRRGVSYWDAMAYVLLAGGALVTLLKAPGMQFGPMRTPVICYALALSAMAAKAVSGAYIVGSTGAWVAAAGGLLFYASDVILSFQMFNRKKPRSMVAWNLVTYYLGQGLLAISLLLR